MSQKVQQSTSKGIRVAVYGTLKRGHSNHYLLANPNVAFLGRTILTGPYHMVSLGGFPAVVRSPDVKLQNRILCEVYRIDEETLKALDVLEGNGQFYTRDQVVTPWKKAWMYFGPGEFLNDKRYPPVPSGAWRPSKEEEEYLDNHLQIERLSRSLAQKE